MQWPSCLVFLLFSISSFSSPLCASAPRPLQAAMESWEDAIFRRTFLVWASERASGRRTTISYKHFASSSPSRSTERRQRVVDRSAGGVLAATRSNAQQRAATRSRRLQEHPEASRSPQFAPVERMMPLFTVQLAGEDAVKLCLWRQNRSKCKNNNCNSH